MCKIIKGEGGTIGPLSPIFLTLQYEYYTQNMNIIAFYSQNMNITPMELLVTKYYSVKYHRFPKYCLHYIIVSL